MMGGCTMKLEQCAISAAIFTVHLLLVLSPCVHYVRNWCFLLCREIMKEIQRLRVEHEQHSKVSPAAATAAGQSRNPTLLAELRLLRQRRDELEARMAALQESRRELMVQLEGLMKLLKVRRPRLHVCLLGALNTQVLADIPCASAPLVFVKSITWE